MNSKLLKWNEADAEKREVLLEKKKEKTKKAAKGREKKADNAKVADDVLVMLVKPENLVACKGSRKSTVCDYCGREGRALKHCGKCSQVGYCGKECQVRTTFGRQLAALLCF